MNSKTLETVSLIRLLLILNIILCTTINSLSAQDLYNKESQKSLDKKYTEKIAKAIFVEYMNGTLNISYDMRFGKRRDGLGGRIGVGAAPMVNAMLIPIELNYLLGHRNHQIEVGVNTIAGIGSSPPPEDRKRTFGIGRIGPMAGYRFQHDRGVIFRIGYNPYILANHLQHGCYLSIGVAF